MNGGGKGRGCRLAKSALPVSNRKGSRDSRCSSDAWDSGSDVELCFDVDAESAEYHLTRRSPRARGITTRRHDEVGLDDCRTGRYNMEILTIGAKTRTPRLGREPQALGGCAVLQSG